MHFIELLKFIKKKSRDKEKIRRMAVLNSGKEGKNKDSQVLNCYNVGNVNSNVANYIGGIIGQSTGNILVEHNYFLENVVNNSDGNSMNGVEAKTAEELKEIYNILGESWKEDNEGINNGYPILNWQ